MIPTSASDHRSSSSALVALFAGTLFLSALLLFFVQPMVGKLILPLLGGTSSVWNTCMVFFQTLLLLGYLYAHLLCRYAPPRLQIGIHLGLLATALLTLPIALGSSVPPTESTPVFWLLTQLTVAVGLPFFALSASAPLFQHWFTRTGHPHATDPYYLYSASNAGSFVALLCYPLFIEPALRLHTQSQTWSWGFGALLAFAVACGVFARPARGGPTAGAPETGTPANGSAAGEEAAPDRRQILLWLLYSFIPSSLLLGVTTYMTNDVASVPLLWVVPLALYLATFILVFARKQILPHTLMVHVLHLMLVPLVVLVFLQPKQPAGLAVVLHPLAFFVITMVYHGELARRRPAARYLTQFYLWMSVGGMLGGVFNALIAPVIFNSLIEYQLITAVAFLALPTGLLRWSTVSNPRKFALIAVSTITTTALWLAIVDPENDKLVIHALLAGIALMLSSVSLRGNPRVAMLVLLGGIAVGSGVRAGMVHYYSDDELLFATRNYFGIHKVQHNAADGLRHIFHGTTDHGQQSTQPELRRTALAYHHPDGPLGQVFTKLQARSEPFDVGVVGLGAGAIAAYRQPGQTYVFYEIDPAVAYIAQNPDYFTYLSDCADGCQVVMGDGRLTVADAAPGAFGLLILDAYSSDSVPVHLLTREALQTYLGALSDDGLLAFNISNRYMDLEPVLGNLARDAGLVGLAQHYHPGPEARQTHSSSSSWVILARRPELLASWADDPRWSPLRDDRGAAIWTDDYANILRAYRWWGR